MIKMPNCPRCGSEETHKAGWVPLARARTQRYKCEECYKKFHQPGHTLPIKEVEGYLDIETTQAGRGAGNFGIILSWAIKSRDTDAIWGRPLEITKRSLIHDGLLVDEGKMVEEFCRVAREFDVLYTWYGTGHDIPILRSRAEYHGLDFPAYQEVAHKDLYYAWRGKFKLHSNRQDAVDEFLGADPQKWKLAPAIWVNAMFGSLIDRQYSIDHIWEHNKEDVWQTQRIHNRIEKYLTGQRNSI